VCRPEIVARRWLIAGDLKCLRQMMLTRAPRGRPPFLTSAEDLKQAYAALSPALRQIVAQEVDRLLGERRIYVCPKLERQGRIRLL
jgi:hypothetical protein